MYYKVLTTTFFLFLGALYCVAQTPGKEKVDKKYIQENAFKNLNEALKTPEKVYVLDLRDQSLDKFPMEILQLVNLRVLILGNSKKNEVKNNITFLPEEIRTLTKLEILDCSDNKLFSLPESIGDLHNLVELDCSFNKLDSLPKSISKLKALKVLDCSKNSLKKFPKQFSALVNLEILDISSNLFDEFPKAAAKLKQLTYLNFSNNRMRNFPQAVCSLVNLDSLNCSSNELQALSDSIINLKNLKKLDCNSSKLEKLPENIGDLKNLKYLDCSYNNLKSLPSSFAELSTLVEVDCSYNDITKLNMDFSKLTNVSVFNCGYNQLAEWDESANKLTKLRVKLEDQTQKDAAELAKSNAKSEKLLYNIFLLFGLFAAIVLLGLGIFIVFQRRLTNKLATANERLNIQATELALQAKELQEKAHALQEQSAITQEKNNELEALSEELRQQNEVVNEQLIQLEQIQQTKDLMISSVNHDLRNPLNPILNYSSPTYPEKDKKKLLSLIHDRAEDMFALINDIMDVYRADKLQIVPLTNSPHRAANEAIQLITEAKPDLPEIINEIDPTWLAIFEYKYIERVFENLLSNAVKYSEDKESGGRVVFRAEMMDETNSIRLMVQDNGQGIPEDQFVKIFEPFTNPNAKSIGAAKSVGIGLTFCKTILKAHGSNIGIKSEVGKGTTFYFDLPKSAQVVDKVEKDANLPIEVNIHLSKEQKESLHSYVQELQNFQLYEISEMEVVLAKIVSDDPAILLWKSSVQSSIDGYDEGAFAILCNLVLNE